MNIPATATPAQRRFIDRFTSEDGWPEATFEATDDGALVTHVISHRTGEDLIVRIYPDGSHTYRTLAAIH